MNVCSLYNTQCSQNDLTGDYCDFSVVASLELLCGNSKGCFRGACLSELMLKDTFSAQSEPPSVNRTKELFCFGLFAPLPGCHERSS